MSRKKNGKFRNKSTSLAIGLNTAMHCVVVARLMFGYRKRPISLWYEKDRVYDGTGAPKRLSDFAIITCHERQVYRLPIRQT